MTEEKDENRKDGDDMGEINGTEWNFEKVRNKIMKTKLFLSIKNKKIESTTRTYHWMS